jgi:hypothetical protein
MTSRALLVTVPVVHASAPTARAANPATVARAAAPRAARVHLRAYGRGWAVRRNPTPVCARATRAVSTAASIGAIAWPPSVDQSVCLDVPMDLYALLGGTKASLPDADAVLQAMVARLTKDDDEEDSGFTPTALATRTLLVEQAAACLSNQESRKAYEASLLRNPKASTPVRRPTTLRPQPRSPCHPRSLPPPFPTTVHGVFAPAGPLPRPTRVRIRRSHARVHVLRIGRRAYPRRYATPARGGC